MFNSILNSKLSSRSVLVLEKFCLFKIPHVGFDLVFKHNQGVHFKTLILLHFTFENHFSSQMYVLSKLASITMTHSPFRFKFNYYLCLQNILEKWIHWEIPICMNASKKLIHNKWETNKKWKFEFWDIHNFHNCCHMSSFFHVSFEILDLCHIHFRVTTNILRRCWNFLH